MQHIGKLVMLVTVLASSGAVLASGSIYKWVDQHGVTQYTQTPPPKNAKQSQTVRVSRHIPADVREGRARGMVSPETVQAMRSNAQAPEGGNNESATPSLEQTLASARAATDAAAAPQSDARPASFPTPLGSTGTDGISFPNPSAR